jgi:hypothetical protein
MIEIVGALVVGKQYPVDPPELVCFSAGCEGFFNVTWSSEYSPGPSNVGSVMRRNPPTTMSAVDRPIKVIVAAVTPPCSLVRC